MKLIIGLGNPGQKYAHTRHNIGWDALTEWVSTHGGSFQEKGRFQAEVAEVNVSEKKYLAVRPLTFMNLSGEAVLSVAQFYKINPADILLVQDEMDYVPGKLAFCARGGAAGHNGVASVQERLATEEISRLRLGIGRPVMPIAKEDYVLQRFSIEEQEVVKTMQTQAVKAIDDWCGQGTVVAMNTWNRSTI